MKLRTGRSQSCGSMLNQRVVFCIDARAPLTMEDAADVKNAASARRSSAIASAHA